MQIQAVSFASAEAFLASEARTTTACLLLDFTLTGMSGKELQQQLMLEEQPPAIIFITASADAQFKKLVLSRGAIDCLQKPFDEGALVNALERALGADGGAR
jgi:FixJ family two-component response regulator